MTIEKKKKNSRQGRCYKRGKRRAECISFGPIISLFVEAPWHRHCYVILFRPKRVNKGEEEEELKGEDAV
jgi:hypothetical protein